MFHNMVNLTLQKHVTAAEVEAIVKECNAVAETFSKPICAVAVDNAARFVAADVVKQLVGLVLVLRDPGHCNDLLSKDMLDLLDWVKLIFILCDALALAKVLRTDRVNEIRLKLVRTGQLRECAIQPRCDTRMNTAHDYVDSIAKQEVLLTMLH